ncbi:Hypothetical predicted protein [Mytilus galloprovincialis]|uniref:TIR domain-containing protein n=1 Tax=Mytilus galloprovincialis TaxID=29158 RepID=A0A8B6HS53_MYTGA|nr:Hypothetical predicted protein [Mytilus galloprovincialis]
MQPSVLTENQSFNKKDNSVSIPSEKADIVILHTKDENQKQEVADFKSLLEGISYCGIRYHLFEELFPTEQYNSGIEIQTVLRKCNFIFVYISKDYVSSKLKRFGLKESSINDALEATETKTKIKKLSNCELWNMPADKQLSPPDFDFHNFDYRSTDSISKYQTFLGEILQED